MILLPCPNCGPRNASEFRYGGEVRPRPDLNTVTPEEWSDYVYMRANSLGVLREWWYHRAGCGLWFIAERHTKTHEVAATYVWAERPA
jgi:heterotetrameric sarcosine oxidase delta subunit